MIKSIAMRMRKNWRAAGMIMLIALPVMQGCGGGSAGPGISGGASVGGLRIAVPQPDAAEASRALGKIPSSAAKFEITISGEQLSSPITRSFSYPLSGTITIANIPTGVKVVKAVATDSDGNILSGGVQHVTIEEGIYSEVTMTLGYLIETSGLSPSSLAFSTGDALVVKNNTSSVFQVTTADSNCAGFSLKNQGQLKCYPSTAGSMLITAGDYAATAVVSSAANSSLKAAISADATYGEAPLQVYLSAGALSSANGSGSITYKWNLGGGELYSSSDSLSGQSPMAVFKSPGDYVISLTVTQGSETAADNLRITVVSAMPPSITSIFPSSHFNVAEGTITITGADFEAGATVLIGDVKVTANVVSDTQIQAIIPVDFTPGDYAITVTNKDGQSDVLSNALSVKGRTSSSCPATGGYWKAAIGGRTGNAYSETGSATFTGTSVSTVSLKGDASGLDNSETLYSGALNIGSDGIYSISYSAESEKITPSNDCSLLAGAVMTNLRWGGGLYLKKGTSDDYGSIAVNGTWYGISIKHAQGVSDMVTAGTYVFSGGAITGTAYYGSGDFANEQTLDAQSMISSYAYDSVTGAITISDADGQMSGGVSADGNIIVAASSGSAAQALVVLVRKPESFLFSNLYSGWRGISFGTTATGGESGLDAVKLDSSAMYSTGKYMNTAEGLILEMDSVAAASLQSAFSSGDTGAALTSYEEYPSRLFVGYGLDIVLAAETNNPDGSFISVLTKTDVSAPVGNPPVANAGDDKTGSAGMPTSLDGTASIDPDSNTLTYSWLQTGGPSAALNNPASPTPTFTPSVTGAYQYDLQVYDGTFLSATDSIVINVSDPSATCGNNIVEIGETCDDGNTVAGDGCSAVCFSEVAIVFGKVSSGTSHSCGINSSGAVKCWGDNTYGKLGNGTTTASLTPVQVNGLTGGATSVAAGDSHSCAVASGQVYCWGNNSYGKLGDGTTSQSIIPVAVTGITTATKVITGTFHSCALLSGGTVKCWGYDMNGELGDDAALVSSSTPKTVSGLYGAVSISGRFSHNCALIYDGTVKCWGYNANSESSGDGLNADVTTPVEIPGVTEAVAIGVGSDFSCVAISSGGTTCWGDNSSGQFGNGQVSTKTPPTAGVSSSFGVFKSLSGGSRFMCGTTTGNAPYCWGENAYGQLGNNSTTTSQTPVAVGSAAGEAVYISAGHWHACQEKTTANAITCWGINTSGQLGDGTTTEAHSEVSVAGF